MVIKKIKRVKEEVIVSASKISNGINVKAEVQSEPNPTLFEELKRLNSFIIAMCELPENSIVNILGLSFSYHGELDTQAVVITFQKKLQEGNTAITINTPLKYVEKAGLETPNSQVMSEKMASIIKQIEKEATAFLQGCRKQTDLFQ